MTEPIHRMPDTNCPDFPGICECPRKVTIRHGYLKGREYEIVDRTVNIPNGSDALMEMMSHGNMAAMKAMIEGAYGTDDAPFYYGKINQLGYIVSHSDIYDKMRTTESESGPGFAVINIEPGHNVVCDDCNKDFTDLPDTGGLLFQSKAIGPCCQQTWIDGAVKHNETNFIRAICPAGKSFADWVREDVR